MPVYGDEITKPGADILFHSCTAVKSRVQTAVTSALGHDREAKRYLNGTDVGYVFQRNSLKTLVNRLQDDDDCIILFTGCKFDDEHHIPGRPTLIAFAFNVSTDENGSLIARINLGNENEPDGFQHPGNFEIDVHVPADIPVEVNLTEVTFVR